MNIFFNFLFFSKGPVGLQGVQGIPGPPGPKVIDLIDYLFLCMFTFILTG